MAYHILIYFDWCMMLECNLIMGECLIFSCWEHIKICSSWDNYFKFWYPAELACKSIVAARHIYMWFYWIIKGCFLIFFVLHYCIGWVLDKFVLVGTIISLLLGPCKNRTCYLYIGRRSEFSLFSVYTRFLMNWV